MGIPGLLDGDSQGADSPKKAGRLQHLKMRVAVSSHQHVIIPLYLLSFIHLLHVCHDKESDPLKSLVALPGSLYCL